MDLFTVNSSRLTTAHQLRLLHTVHEVLADPAVDGVVVTHGTDTLEESAFFLDLFHDDRRPVVFTGAQQPLDAADGDAAGNLYDALLTAATGRDIGAVIVFGGLGARRPGHRQGAHSGRPGLRRPGRASRWAGWTSAGSPGGGGGRARRRCRCRRRGVAAPRVDIVMHHSDADAVLFDAALAAGARGIVLVGTGAGNANPEVVGGGAPGGRRRRAGRGQHPGGGRAGGTAVHRRRRRGPGRGRRGADRDAACGPGPHRGAGGAAGRGGTRGAVRRAAPPVAAAGDARRPSPTPRTGVPEAG